MKLSQLNVSLRCRLRCRVRAEADGQDITQPCLSSAPAARAGHGQSRRSASEKGRCKCGPPPTEPCLGEALRSPQSGCPPLAIERLGSEVEANDAVGSVIAPAIAFESAARGGCAIATNVDCCASCKSLHPRHADPAGAPHRIPHRLVAAVVKYSLLSCQRPLFFHDNVISTERCRVCRISS